MLINNKKLKLKALKYVLDNGYEFPTTLNSLRELVINEEEFNRLPEATEQEFSQVEDWVNRFVINVAQETNWTRNVKTEWQLDDVQVSEHKFDSDALYRIVQVINIAINVQPQRDAAQRAIRENPGNRYAGEIGDVVTFVVKEVSEITYNYEYNYSILKIVDDEGICYRWSNTQNKELEVGDKIEAKVKSLRELNNGQKITTIWKLTVKGKGFHSSKHSLKFGV